MKQQLVVRQFESVHHSPPICFLIENRKEDSVCSFPGLLTHHKIACFVHPTNAARNLDSTLLSLRSPQSGPINLQLWRSATTPQSSTAGVPRFHSSLSRHCIPSCSYIPYQATMAFSQSTLLFVAAMAVLCQIEAFSPASFPSQSVSFIYKYITVLSTVRRWWVMRNFDIGLCDRDIRRWMHIPSLYMW